MLPWLQEGVSSPAIGQIELDLLRTLPNNIYFDNQEAKGVSVKTVPYRPTDVHTGIPLRDIFIIK